MRIIQVKVNTSAKAPSIKQVGEILEVRFKAVREKGQANKKLIALMAKHFNVSKSQITILRGHTSTHKLIQIN